jgi:ABC-type lipoprotein release transport system permease subunit
VLKADDVAVDDLRAGLASKLGTTFGVRILSARELMDYFVTQVRRAFSVIPIFAGTVYLVILVGLASSLASVLDRRRELAVIRAITPPVARAVVVPSLVIGVAGLGLAAAGGLVLATMWVTQTFQLLLAGPAGRDPGRSWRRWSLPRLVCYLASRAPAGGRRPRWRKLRYD